MKELEDVFSNGYNREALKEQYSKKQLQELYLKVIKVKASSCFDKERLIYELELYFNNLKRARAFYEF